MLGLGSMGAWLVMKSGYKIGLVDIPEERSSHSQPTPKGGGIGILIAFFFASLYLTVSWTFWLPGLMIALISFWGDKIEISPKIRLICQFLLAGTVLWKLELNKFLPFVNNSETAIVTTVLYLALFLIFLIFIVGTANLYNFMDGINGLAGITGVIAFFFLGVVSASNEFSLDYSQLAFGISLATLGFLPFNFPKARVFMGDVGSVLLGFVFGAMVLLVSKNWHDLLAYSGFIFPFYIDEITTMIERIRKKESLTQAHRQHFYQLLANEMKIPHWKISLGFGILQLLISATLITFKTFHLSYTLILYLILSITAFVAFDYLRKHVKRLEVVN
jgi:Fuc2NAc and GlcNAc transferase